jgi:hypothetical protein
VRDAGALELMKDAIADVGRDPEATLAILRVDGEPGTTKKLVNNTLDECRPRA